MIQPVPITMTCPNCRKAVSAAAEHAGRKVACPFCAAHFTISANDGTVALRPTQPVHHVHDAIRFTFACTRCASILEGDSRLSGQTGTCPSCGASFIVPGVDRHTGLPIGNVQIEDDGQNPTPVHAYANAGERAPRIKRLPNGHTVIVCPRCTANMPIDANLCTACGVPFTIDGATQVARTQPSSHGFAALSLALGILAIPSMAWCAPFLAPPGILFGILGIRSANRSMPLRPGFKSAVAGLVLAGVSVLGFIAINYVF